MTQKTFPYYRVAWTLKTWRFVNGDLGQTFPTLEAAAACAASMNRFNEAFEYDAQTVNRRSLSLFLDAVFTIPQPVIWVLASLFFFSIIGRSSLGAVLQTRDAEVIALLLVSSLLALFLLDGIKYATGEILSILFTRRARRGMPA